MITLKKWEEEHRSGLVLLILVLFFAVSQVNATPVVFFDTANPCVTVGQTISVSIFSTVNTDRIQMDRISDTAGGYAGNLFINPNYASPLNPGVAINSDFVLIEDVSSASIPVSPAVSGTLYSFDYLVPTVPLGTTITIFADPTDNAVNIVCCVLDSPGLTPITPDFLSLTVVPEPATFLLFGLAGLILRKRK